MPITVKNILVFRKSILSNVIIYYLDKIDMRCEIESLPFCTIFFTLSEIENGEI